MTSSPEILLTHLDWTIQRLAEILKNEKTPYYRSAALQRFGLTYEMAMKCLRAISEGNAEGSAIEAELEASADWRELTEAYDKIWQSSLKDKPDESEPQKPADEIYHRLNQYHIVFQKLYNRLYDAVKNSKL